MLPLHLAEQALGDGFKLETSNTTLSKYKRCQQRTPATSAECPERGCTVHHWYSEIRSHHASVAQPSLVASATKDNFQDRHSDVPMFEWTGTFLSGSRLHRCFCDTWSETVAICHLRAAVHPKN